MFGFAKRIVHAIKGPDVGPYRFATIAQRGNDWPSANARRDFHFQPVLIQANGYAPLGQFYATEPAVLSELGRVQLAMTQANGRLNKGISRQPLVVDTSVGTKIIPT